MIAAAGTGLRLRQMIPKGVAAVQNMMAGMLAAMREAAQELYDLDRREVCTRRLLQD